MNIHFMLFLQRGTTFVTYCLLSWMTNPSEIWFNLKRKNLLLEEQILSFKSRPQLKREAKMKMTKLLPLKVYRLTSNAMFVVRDDFDSEVIPAYLIIKL